MLAEERLHDGPLHADAATVDQTDLAEPARLRRSKIVVDDGRHVTRQERVEIEAILDRQLDGFLGAQPPTGAGRP